MYSIYLQNRFPSINRCITATIFFGLSNIKQFHNFQFKYKHLKNWNLFAHTFYIQKIDNEVDHSDKRPGYFLFLIGNEISIAN